MLGYLITRGVRTDKKTDRGAQSNEPRPRPRPGRSLPLALAASVPAAADAKCATRYARESEPYSEWSTVLTILPIFCPVSTYR
jgi:hypothetical protein